MSALGWGWPRLLAIETRRNEYLALFLALTLLAGFAYLRPSLDAPALFWANASLTVRQTIFLLGPFVGAAATYAATRNRRRGLADLIATTARPALARDALAAGAVALLGVAAYGALGLYAAGTTALGTGWDGPYFGVVLVGAVAITAQAVLGYAFGMAFPGKAGPMVVAVGLLVLQVIPAAFSRSWLALLSPVALLDASPWYGVRPNVAPGQTLLLLGIGGLGIAAIARLGEDRDLARPVALGALALCLAGVGLVRVSSPDTGGFGFYDTRTEGRPGDEDPLPSEVVCAGGPIPVCVHPAFEAALPELAAKVEAVTAPLADLPGAPTRLVQTQYGPEAAGEGAMSSWSPEEIARSEGLVAFQLESEAGDLALDVAVIAIARELLGGWFVEATTEASGMSALDARGAVQLALLRRTGLDVPCAEDNVSFMGRTSGTGFSAPCAAADRFAALPVAEQDSWLRTHFAGLRAGTVGLDDLP